VIARLAPDLREDATLARMEGDAPLGARWALELTLAYKGTTVRATRSFTSGAVPPSWRQAERWFARAAAVAAKDAPGKIVSWRVDASLGTAPLEAVTAQALPRGALAVASAHLDLADGAWLAAAPVLLGEAPLG
jgi:hypothetical protein